MKCLFVGKRQSITGLLGWLFVVFLVLQGLLPGLVMCFGDNGHVAVETPHSRFPCPVSQSQVPCRDLPLSSVWSADPFLVTAPSLALQGLVPPPAMAAAPLPLPATGVLSAVLPYPIPTARSPIASLRTVVLLI